MRTVATTLAVLLAATTGACAAPADTGETGAPTPWAGAPVVLRVSDAVRPGEVIGLYGEGLGEGLRVVVAAGALTTRPAGALEAKTLPADHHGQFAMVEVPASLPAGPFTFWAANAAGWCGPPPGAHRAPPPGRAEDAAGPGRRGGGAGGAARGAVPVRGRHRRGGGRPADGREPATAAVAL